MTNTKWIEKAAPFALDIVIVVALSVLAGIGRLDALVVVGLLGPMLGARVANAGKNRSSDKNDDGPNLPPSALLLLLAGASRLLRGTQA